MAGLIYIINYIINDSESSGHQELTKAATNKSCRQRFDPPTRRAVAAREPAIMGSSIGGSQYASLRIRSLGRWLFIFLWLDSMVMAAEFTFYRM